MTKSSNRLLRSLVDLFNEQSGLTQLWRMSGAAPLHLRFGSRCEHLLILSGDGLIVLADEVGRWNITPGGASELGCLHLVRLCDEARGPQRCFRWLEVVVELLFAIQDVEAAIGLDAGELTPWEGDTERSHFDIIIGRFTKDT